MVEDDRENVENGRNAWENEFYFWSRVDSAVLIGRRIKTASLSVVAFFVVVDAVVVVVDAVGVVVDAVGVVVDAVGVVVDEVGVVVGVTFRFVTLKIKLKNQGLFWVKIKFNFKVKQVKVLNLTS